MLREISIKNVAVIKSLSLQIEEGMTALTGETGAGKSIIIDSINMILGDRTNKTLVRYGEKKAIVQAVFSLDAETAAMIGELGIEPEEEQVIITREVTGEGKSSARINGMLVTLAQLREIAPHLINIHGQLDNQALLMPSRHTVFLDRFAGNESLLQQYQECYRERREILGRLTRLQTSESERMQRIDLLEYQVKEISSARLAVGEDEELAAQRETVANAEKISMYASAAFDQLYGGEEAQSAYDALSSAAGALDQIREFSPSVQQIWETVSEMVYTVEDAAHEMKNYSESVEYDPAVLNDIEERLDLIAKLKRKYGGTIQEIQAYHKQAQKELEELKASDERIDEMKKQAQELEMRLKECAAALSEARKRAAETLEKRIEASLTELDMEKAGFTVQVSSAQDFTANGGDTVEFMIRTNPGEPFKPLVKIASGGELSRVMLAIKSILADSDSVDTLIFDEIDTGVSGMAAQKIAHKLSDIAKHKQVICISHLPQIASFADHHFLIQKTVADGRTATKVTELDSRERQEEIARITDGEITKTSLEHAREMLERAEAYKCGRLA